MAQMERRTFARLLTAGLFTAPGCLHSAARQTDYYYLVAADPQIWWKEETVASWKRVVSMVNRLKPAFLVICGDLLSLPNDHAKWNADRADRMARAYLEVVQGLDKGIPVHHVAGNHDVARAPRPESLVWYRKTFGVPWYSFEHQNSLYIVLEANTLIMPDAVQKQARTQMAWLEKLLKASAKRRYDHRTVYMHQPLFVRSVDEKDSYHNFPMKQRKRLLALLQDTDVEIAFSGHLHSNAYARHGDMELITTASCCHGNQKAGMRIVHVTRERIMDKFYSLDEMPEELSEMRIR